jgi:hypothetical protein
MRHANIRAEGLALMGFRWSASAALIATGLACVAAQAIAATAGYDGVYRGDATRTRGDDSICGKASYQASFTVVNGQFNIVYDATRHVGVNLVIQADGSFSGSQMYKSTQQQSQVKASGRISGNILDAQVEGQACARSYHLTKG